jgi:hypothetical protein
MPTAPLLSTMMCSKVATSHPALDFTGNVPAGGMRFKWDTAVSEARVSLFTP